MDVHWYEDGPTWVVAANGKSTTFHSRAEAFAHARQIALDHSPSQLIKGRPGAGGAPAGNVDPPPRMSREPDDREPVDGTPSGPARRPAGPAYVDRAAGEPPEVDPPSLDWTQLAGPAWLGRSLLLPPGADVPLPWANARQIDVARALDDPAAFLATAREAFLTRTPVVYRVDPTLAAPVGRLEDRDVWSIDLRFEFEAESAWSLMTANAVDARAPSRTHWPWTIAAIAAGAAPSETASADIVLADGRRALCDGGPLDLSSRPTSPSGSIGKARYPDPPDAVSSTPTVSVLPRISVERGSVEPPGHDEPGAELAADQLRAVDDPGGVARIIAPAGSGKTRVLTERARFLLTTKHLPTSAVTLVAFNKRAQTEMRDRTLDLRGLQIQTLNALALAVLNGTGGFAPRDVRVRTIDELAVRRILADMVKFPRRANTDPAAAWIDALSSVRLGLRDPASVEADFGGDVDGFADFFPRYRRELQRQGIVDFDEQIYGAIELLLSEPSSRRAAQRACRLLLVDEFQDLTPAHLLLVRLLAAPELLVFGVGDDDQTIYGYSGASPVWLVDYDTFFPGASHHALEVNYRCPTPVVEAATSLLTHNRVRVPKSIRPAPHTGAVTPIQVVLHDEPVCPTLDRIRALVTDDVPPAHIVVLTRVNALLAPIQAGLFEAGIPCNNRDGSRFLERTGVAAALSWLTIAIRPERLGSAHLQRAARRPGRSLSPKLLQWLSEQHDTAGLTRLAGRLNAAKDTDKVLGLVADIDRISALARLSDTATILEFVRSDIGLDRAMQTLDAAHRGRNATAHSDDLRALIALGRLHPDPGSFAAWLPTVFTSGDEVAGVQLSTVHRVKGLEWPHVVVHDVTQGMFPHHLSTDIEEERRVFHVAITRCQQTLTLVADSSRPSMFLDELDEPAPPVVERGSAAGPSAIEPARGAVAEVAATIGLELTWGGHEARVSGIEADHIVLAAGRATFAVTYGSLVTIDGRPRRIVRSAPERAGRTARRGIVDTGPSEHPEVLDALKSWRLARARGDAVPAYVVANDRTLRAIADELPRTLEELSGISGIGSAKLERYGDEILAVIDDSLPS